MVIQVEVDAGLLDLLCRLDWLSEREAGDKPRDRPCNHRDADRCDAASMREHGNG